MYPREYEEFLEKANAPQRRAGTIALFIISTVFWLFFAYLGFKERSSFAIGALFMLVLFDWVFITCLRPFEPESVGYGTVIGAIPHPREGYYIYKVQTDTGVVQATWGELNQQFRIKFYKPGHPTMDEKIEDGTEVVVIHMKSPFTKGLNAVAEHEDEIRTVTGVAESVLGLGDAGDEPDYKDNRHYNAGPLPTFSEDACFILKRKYF